MGDWLIHGLILDGQGGGRAIDGAGLAAWSPEQGPLWLHLDRSTEQTQRWLREQSGLDESTCDALLAEETRPRIARVGDGAIVILRGVNLNPGQQPDDMISLRMWIDRHRMISLRQPHLLAAKDVRDALSHGHGPGNIGDLLVELAERLTARIRPVLANQEDIVDDLEQRVVETRAMPSRAELGKTRREAITLRRYIAPQRDAISRLAVEPFDWLSQSHRRQLHEISDRTTRYVEDLDALRERASVVHEELISRLSEQMNRNMYVLSLIAAIFLPLGLLTGLLGINVGGIPGEDYHWAFLIVCGILAIIAAFQIWLFRQRHML